jgi:hypothetical protein
MAQAIVPEKPTVVLVQGRPWTRRAVWVTCGLLPFIPFYFHAGPSRAWSGAIPIAFIVVSGVAVLLRVVERPRPIREVRSAGRIPINR